MSFLDWLGDSASGAWDYVTDNPEVAAAVLGGLAGAQGSEDQVTTTTPFMFQGQEEGIVNFLDQSKQQYQAGPQQFYPGGLVAPLDQNVIDSQNAALGTLPGQNQLADLTALGAGDLLGGGAGRIEGFDLPGQVGYGIDPGLENAVMNPIMDRLTNDVLPSLDLQATSQGAFGGTRQAQQKASAASDAVESAADAVARANLEARGQNIGQRGTDIQAMLQGRTQDINQNQIYNNAVRSGVSSLPTAMDALLVPSQVQGQVGQARTAYEQALIDADKSRFDFNQQASIDAIDRLGQRMNLAPSGNIITNQGQDGNWMNILGGALSGVGLVNSFQNTTPNVALEPIQTTSTPMTYGWNP